MVGSYSSIHACRRGIARKHGIKLSQQRIPREWLLQQLRACQKSIVRVVLQIPGHVNHMNVRAPASIASRVRFPACAASPRPSPAHRLILLLGQLQRLNSVLRSNHLISTRAQKFARQLSTTCSSSATSTVPTPRFICRTPLLLTHRAASVVCGKNISKRVP